MKTKIQEAYDFIRTLTDEAPETGIVLGTGLGDLAHYIESPKKINYSDIPHFPLSTVEFHSGNLIFGTLSGKSVVAMQGRFHFYEGYSMHEITFPVRVMKMLGVKNLIISNACGSMNTDFKKGSIVIVEDHINLLGGNPLIGINDTFFGERFVDMSQPYSNKFISIAEEIESELGLPVKKGVYAAMSGPSLETRAEYRFLRTIGADLVGMSTVPETIVARQCGMKVLCLSIVTDECDPDNLKAVNINEIISAAAQAEPHLTAIVREFINRL